MAPGFLTALDQQLRSDARRLIGVDDIANGAYALLPPDNGFTVRFCPATDGGVVGLIEAYLVDPTAFAHQVTFAWRAKGAADQPIQPGQERDDLEFFWVVFPVAELAAGTHVDTAAAAAAVTARFPVEWDVHQWETVHVVLHARGAFTADELEALDAAVVRAVRDWDVREQNAMKTIDYVAERETTRDCSSVSWYLDLNVAGADAVVAMINALGAALPEGAIARCSVGRRR